MTRGPKSRPLGQPDFSWTPNRQVEKQWAALLSILGVAPKRRRRRKVTDVKSQAEVAHIVKFVDAPNVDVLAEGLGIPWNWAEFVDVVDQIFQQSDARRKSDYLRRLRHPSRTASTRMNRPGNPGELRG